MSCPHVVHTINAGASMSTNVQYQSFNDNLLVHLDQLTN